MQPGPRVGGAAGEQAKGSTVQAWWPWRAQALNSAGQQRQQQGKAELRCAADRGQGPVFPALSP